MKKFFLFIIISIFFSCQKKSGESPLDYKIHMSDFNLEHFSNGVKKWDLRCRKSVIDEKNNNILCYDTLINLFSDSKITTVIKGFKGFGDMNMENYYIEKDVSAVSFTESIRIYTQKLYFDSKKELIYSKTNTKIIKEKEGIEIDSIGFEARSDLSNIKIFKHTTRKITTSSKN
jgi:hypothetical protein